MNQYASDTFSYIFAILLSLYYFFSVYWLRKTMMELCYEDMTVEQFEKPDVKMSLMSLNLVPPLSWLILVAAGLSSYLINIRVLISQNLFHITANELIVLKEIYIFYIANLYSAATNDKRKHNITEFVSFSCYASIS